MLGAETMAKRKNAAQQPQVALKATAGGGLSEFQKFEVQRVHRSQLKLADYNPRQNLSRHKRQKLEKNLRSVGMVTAIIWNKRTGNIVGGHQRLQALDALEGDQDYTLDVSVVDMPAERERTQNVFLNNPLVQGTWDMQLLGEILREDPAGIEATGFDPMDVQVMFDDAKLAPLFNDDTNDELLSDIARVGAIKERPAPKARPEGAGHDDSDVVDADDDVDDDDWDSESGSRSADVARQDAALRAEGDAILEDDDEPDEVDGMPDEDDQTPRTPEEAFEREKWQEIKAKQKERMQQRQMEDDTEFYAVVGFADRDQRKRLCLLLGIETSASFADGGRVLAKLKRTTA